MRDDNLIPEPPPEEENLYCLECGYNLRGLPGMSRTCPECGHLNLLDETGVAAKVIARMRRRVTWRVRFASVAACFATLFLLLGVALGSGAALTFCTFAALFWIVLRTVEEWPDTHLPTMTEVDGRVLTHSVWVVVTTMVCSVLACIGWALGSRFSQWFGPRWRDLCIAIWTVVTVGVVYLISLRLYRQHKQKLAAAVEDHAVALAQRWHHDRLRQPPEKRPFR